MKFRPTSHFVRNENGSLSVEACFAVPILAWAIVATFVFFDAFKTLNISQKATYTVADMISREEAPIDDNYVDALFETFQYLAGESGPSAMRLTLVTMEVDEDTGDPVLMIDRSEGRNYADLDELDPIINRIPILSPGEQLIVVESVQQWTPAFAVGLATYQFREVALARPRFAPRVCWETLVGCVTPAPATTGSTAGEGT